MDRLDVIKIDTEGHDLRVLRGADETLRRLRPTVLLEFSSLALSLHESTLPADALTMIRNTFAHVFVIEPDGQLWPIRDDTEAWKLLHSNATVRPVHDLLCLFDDSPALSRLHVREHAASSLDFDLGLIAAQGESNLNGPVDAEAQLAATREELSAAKAAVNELSAEIAAVRRTFSWRLTEPLRKLRARFQ